MGTRKQQAKETSTLHLINNDMPRFANTRRQSRECTLHMLYAFDNCSMDEKAVFECFDPLLPVEIPYREFAVTIFRGVCENQKEIDSLIEKYADNWEISRMTVIDRNIMRLAAYEILYMPKTPISVIIDEAVEISKAYSNKDSGKFVNGILDKLKNERKSK
jgi:N utilization substance protein B